MSIPDSYDIWLDHQARMDRRAAARPVCDSCEAPIQEDYCYEVNGFRICPECMETFHRKELPWE